MEIDRNELRENLVKTLIILKENDNLNSRYINEQNTPKSEFFNKYGNKIIFGILFFFGTVIPFFDGHQGEALGAIFGLAIVYWIWDMFIVDIVRNKVFDKELKKVKIIKKEILEDISLRCQNNINTIQEYSFVPPAYRYVYAVESFIFYIDNNRADTIKECVNAFEQDTQHIQRMNEIRNQQNLSRQLIKSNNAVITSNNNVSNAIWANTMSRL